jgi:hypothetical protein
MYTLDGRMRFELALQPEQEEAFHQRKLLEASLNRRGETFELQFNFGQAATAPAEAPESPAVAAAAATSLPAYLSVEEAA